MIMNLLKSLALTGGEWVIYFLILCSILAVAVMIERGILLKREKEQMKKIKELFAKFFENQDKEKVLGEINQMKSLPAHVLSAGLSRMDKGVDAVEEQIASVTNDEKQRLENRMIILGTLGNNAVYIGLFGTVLGVIKAFHDLAQESGAGPETVMQGLSEALIATAVGLLVAIPCVIAYNILQKTINDLLSETEAMTHSLLSHLKSKK